VNAVNMPLTNRQQIVAVLYDEVIRTANFFLHNCKHFSSDTLREESPTYSHVAYIMGKVAGMIILLADDFDPMTGQQAGEYCRLMESIGIAIDQRDDIALETSIRELQRKPGV
jgi:hypothetical protein